ncbi:hypothetical protein ACFCX0_06340 [Streptomyces sp. NPDC056352]|uniref:hypothetical protein n=1 Tax=Streptomyces sp. NPDC056352 TaxID=3345791 RepID=UPI0035D7EE6C
MRVPARRGVLDHCRQRPSDDPYLWSTTLFDKVAGPAPSCWLFAPLMVSAGVFGPSVNVTATQEAAWTAARNSARR